MADTKTPAGNAWLVVGVTGAIALLTWLMPDRKLPAVLGRFNYIEFLLIAFATLVFVLSFAVALTPANRRRKVIFRIAAICLGAFLALLTWEIVARILDPENLMDNPWYSAGGEGFEAGEELPFTRPAHVHWEGLSRGDLAILNCDDDPYARRIKFVTDFQGFHNSQDLHEADLVFLGDSFTEAGNVLEEETFVNRTAGALQVSARNLGRALHAPPMELIILKRYGLACAPKAVIWQIAESNDLHESVVFQRWLDAGRPQMAGLGNPPPRADESLSQRSPTCRLYAALRRPRPWPYAGAFHCNDGSVREVRFLSLPDQRLSRVGHAGWPLIADAIREGARILKRAGVKLIVLLIPAKERAMGPAVEFLGADPDRLKSDREIPYAASMAAQLQILCSELGVKFIDTTSVLRERANKGELVYLPFDTHLSPEGHRVVSEQLLETLAPEKLGADRKSQ